MKKYSVCLGNHPRNQYINMGDYEYNLPEGSEPIKFGPSQLRRVRTNLSQYIGKYWHTRDDEIVYIGEKALEKPILYIYSYKKSGMMQRPLTLRDTHRIINFKSLDYMKMEDERKKLGIGPEILKHIESEFQHNFKYKKYDILSSEYPKESIIVIGTEDNYYKVAYPDNTIKLIHGAILENSFSKDKEEINIDWFKQNKLIWTNFPKFDKFCVYQCYLNNGIPSYKVVIKKNSLQVDCNWRTILFLDMYSEFDGNLDELKASLL